MTELHDLSLVEVSQRLKRREVSPVELVNAMLERIHALDPQLHSYAIVTPELALRQAKEAEAEIGKGKVRGPLHGVPIALKDLCATPEAPTRVGALALGAWNPNGEATVAARLREAGAVLLGKLQMTEGAYGAHHPEIAVPVNPWRADAWPGVSSSGSGVAPAAGLCFGALGTDTGGSIRFPTYCCSLSGIKPTWGRVSRHGVFPLAESLDHVGPMARTVADAAAMLGVIAGADPDDPTALGAPVPDYLASVETGVRGLRIGYDEDYCSAGVAPEISAALRDAAERLRDRGAEIVAVSVPPRAETVARWTVMCAAEAALAHAETFPSRADQYGPLLRALLEHGRSASALDYAAAHRARLYFAGALARVFEGVDAMLSPTWHRPTPTHQQVEELLASGEVDALISFTAPFDMSGSPALCLPAGFDDHGLPYGFQVIGRHLGEETLCQIGHAYQQDTDWHRRRPSLATAA